MGESRVELLAWINALLGLNYTKIEQLGTGAAYCQVFDSLWGDVQMHKVKFDARLEYEYVANYKVLQLAFDNHKVDKAIPVERLIKCKFQENLEFLQWAKRFHDMHWPGGYYDATARRKAGPSAGAGSRSKTSSTTSLASRSAGASHTSSAPAPRTTRTGSASTTGSRPGSSHAPSAAAAALQRQVDDLTRVTEEQAEAITTVERERDFYYSKLRDIEILVQQEAARGVTSDLMALIQQILYATDDGFEVPDAGVPTHQEDVYDDHNGYEAEYVEDDIHGHPHPHPHAHHGHHGAVADDMETF